MGLAEQFEHLFRRLLARERIWPLEPEMSFLWQVAATSLLGQSVAKRWEGSYFDGVEGLTAVVKSARKVEFDGAMWVGDQNRQWTEPFRASMVDKTCTKLGIWVTIRVGDEQGEGELTETFRPWKTGACETQRL